MSDKRIFNLPLNELRKRHSEKWQEYPEDVIPMFVAEMDNQTPEFFRETVLEFLELGDFGYLSEPGVEDFIQAYNNFAKRHWNWTFDSKLATDVIDVMKGGQTFVNSYLDNNLNNGIIISTPVYPPFMFKLGQNYRIFDAPLNDDFRLDFANLEAIFKEVSQNCEKAIYCLCNPANPAGTVPTKDELTKLVALSNQYNIVILSDEIHSPLVQNSLEFTPLLSLPDTKLCITTTSASKGFSLPGIKAALLISNPYNNEFQDFITNYHRGSSTYWGAKLQTVALNKGDEWLNQVNLEIRQNIDLLDDLLQEYFPKATFRKPDATYLAWVGFEAYQDKFEGVSSSKYFLKQKKVAFSDGNTFSLGFLTGEKTKWANYVRINLATNPQIIKTAIKRLV